LILPPNASTETCVNPALARESNSFGNATRLDCLELEYRGDLNPIGGVLAGLLASALSE
jgi:hypothetical protein